MFGKRNFRSRTHLITKQDVQRTQVNHSTQLRLFHYHCKSGVETSKVPKGKDPLLSPVLLILYILRLHGPFSKELDKKERKKHQYRFGICLELMRHTNEVRPASSRDFKFALEWFLFIVRNDIVQYELNKK